MGLSYEKVRLATSCAIHPTNGYTSGLNYSSIPDYVHRLAHDVLVMPSQHRKGIDLLPQAFISNKQPVEPNADPRFTLRQDLFEKSTKTYRDWAEAREVDEWLQSVGGVLETGWNDQ